MSRLDQQAEQDLHGSDRSGDAATEVTRDLARLRPVPLAGFMDAEPVPHPFIAWPILPALVLTLLAGHGGAGKSILALILAVHTACGKAWGGIEFTMRRVVYVSLEDAGDLVRYRLKRVCEAYDIDPALVEENLTILDGTGGDASLMVELNEHGQRQLAATPLLLEMERAAEGAGFVIVDNASDAFSGNENERRQVRTFIRRLVSIATRNDAGLMLLAHVDKHAARTNAAGNSYSGSTAWHNSARSRLALAKSDDGTVTLTHEKYNLSREAAPITLRWNDHGVLVPVETDPQAAARAADQDRDDAHEALRALSSAARLGLDVTCAQSGTATSWHVLAPLPGLPEAFKGKPEGRRRLHTALLRLAGEGLIERQGFRTPSRNLKERWALTQAGEIFVSNLRASFPPYPPFALTHEGRSSVGGGYGTHEGPTQDSRTHEGLAAGAYRGMRDGEL